jgi:hypothetical protein
MNELHAGLSLEQIDFLWATEEYKANNQEAETIEGLEAEKAVDTRPSKTEA